MTRVFDIFVPDVKDLSLFELTKNYLNKEPVKLKHKRITFTRVVGKPTKTVVIAEGISKDYLCRSEYWDEVLDRVFT